MRGIKNIRLTKYNYASDGYYFVTIITNFRNNYFMFKEKEVERELKDLKDNTVGLSLDFFVVMPNHVHIIFVLKGCGLLLGEIVRRFKAKVSYAFGISVWQPNYYEHVIRNEKALNRIREYILYNRDQIISEFKQFYE